MEALERSEWPILEHGILTGDRPCSGVTSDFLLLFYINLPNCLVPLIVSAIISIAFAILLRRTLVSVLGFPAAKAFVGLRPQTELDFIRRDTVQRRRSSIGDHDNNTWL